MTPNPNPSPELRALADIFDHFKHSKQAPGHDHDVPGIWDADNGPDKAGKPCDWCEKWERARAVLASPQALPAPGEVELREAYIAGFAQALYNLELTPNAFFDAWLEFGRYYGLEKEQFDPDVIHTPTLATVAAANDEGERADLIEAFTEFADKIDRFGFVNALDGHATRLRAAIRLLSQGGGK